MSTMHACALSARFMSFLPSLTCNDKMNDCDQIVNGIFSYNLTKLKQPDLSTLSQQTTTCDVTCSVSEFTSSTGSIHMNQLDYVNKFDVSTCVSREITSFPRDDTC